MRNTLFKPYKLLTQSGELNFFTMAVLLVDVPVLPSDDTLTCYHFTSQTLFETCCRNQTICTQQYKSCRVVSGAMLSNMIWRESLFATQMWCASYADTECYILVFMRRHKLWQCISTCWEDWFQVSGYSYCSLIPKRCTQFGENAEKRSLCTFVI